MLRKNFILKLILIFIFCISILTCSLADDIIPLEENFDIFSYLNEDTYIETSNSPYELPSINSRAYVVLDRKTSSVLVGKNEFSKRKMASTTKIMTALIIIENCNLSENVIITKKASGTGGSKLNLKTGDIISVNDLLYGLMLRSGNDAAVALAEHSSGSIEEFSKIMNRKALELGLKNTHFSTPHGLDQDDHYTTAYELALLTNYALNNKTFAKIVGTKNFTITINGYPKEISNTNELLGNFEGIYGVKTGFTNGANRCLVTACKRNNKDLICVVLGADTKKFRTQDSIKLLTYSLNNFTYIDINKKIEDTFNDWIRNNSNYFNIYKGLTNELELSCPKLEYGIIPIRTDLQNKIRISIRFNNKLTAPIVANEKIGNLTVTNGNNIIFSLEIHCKNTIRKKNMFDYLLIFFKDFYFKSNLYNCKLK